MSENKEKIIKVGLKANAHFLFSQMKGDTMGGVEGGIMHSAIVFLTKIQFESFKLLIKTFGGDVEKSLVVSTRDDDGADYSCYFIKNKN